MYLNALSLTSSLTPSPGRVLLLLYSKWSAAPVFRFLFFVSVVRESVVGVLLLSHQVCTTSIYTKSCRVVDDVFRVQKGSHNQAEKTPMIWVGCVSLLPS